MSKDIIKEIIRMAVFMIPVCLLMVGVFYILVLTGTVKTEMGAVWLGALVGYAAAVLNYLLLAVTVTFTFRQTAAKSRSVTSLSYTGRLILLAIIIILSVKSPYINYVAVIIPLIFPRILVMIFGTMQKKKAKADGAQTAEAIGAAENAANAVQEWPDDEDDENTEEIPAGTYIEGEPEDDDSEDEEIQQTAADNSETEERN